MKQLNIIQVSRAEIAILSLLVGYNLICAGSFYKTCFCSKPFSSNFIFSSLTRWVFFFFNIYLVIYLAKLGLSFSTQDLRSYLQHVGSLIVACGI